MADKEKTVLLKIKGEDDTGQVISKFKGAITAAFSVAAIGVFVKAIQGAVESLKEMAQRAGDLEEVSAGFARSYGKQADALKKLQDASDGMIDNYDLMRIASKSANLQVTTDVNKLAGIMQTAQILSDEMGADFQETYESLVEGIGKGSTKILTSMGVVVPQALTEAMSKMSQTKQTATLLNYVIETGNKLALQYGDSTLSISDKILVLQTKWTNLKDAMITEFAPVFSTALDSLLRWGNTLSEVAAPGVEKLKSKLEGDGGLIGSLMSLFSNANLNDEEFKKLVETTFNQFIDSLTKDGGIIDSVEGVVNAIKNFVQSGDADKMAAQFKTVMEAAEKVANAILAISAAFTAVSALWNSDSNKLATINTGVGKSVSAQDLINAGKNAFPTTAQTTIGPTTGFTSTASKYFGTKATGGMASGWTMAGENGPEMIKLPSGSHVYNNEDSKKMMGGSNITININAPTYGINDLKSSILEAVNEATAKQNRLANYNLL